MIYAIQFSGPLGAASDWPSILALLRQYSSKIPIYFELGWIKRESGGDNADTTSSREYGFFQISPQESAAMGFDHNRIHVDPAYAVQTGVQLINEYAGDASDRGYTYGTDDFWHIVKLIHTVGLGGTDQLIAAAGGGSPSWAQIEAAADPGMMVGGRTAQSAFGIVDDTFSGGADLADQLGVDLSEGSSSLSPSTQNAMIAVAAAAGVLGAAALAWWVILPRVAPRWRRQFAFAGEKRSSRRGRPRRAHRKLGSTYASAI